MRFLLPVGATLAFGLAAPAQADVTARYSGNGKYGATVSVAVDEAGQVRAEGGPPNQPDQRLLFVTRAGAGYFSGVDAQGRFVARQDDLLAVAADVMRTIMPETARAAMGHAARVRFEIVEGGMETVAGRQGRVYRLRAIVGPAPVPASAHGGDGTENPEALPPPFEIVISEDPELAPVGREVARLFGLGAPLVEALLGAEPAAVGQVRALLARGTPIRIADEFHLRSVSTAPIPDSAFVLPGRLVTRAELRGRAPGAQGGSD